MWYSQDFQENTIEVNSISHESSNSQSRANQAAIGFMQQGSLETISEHKQPAHWEELSESV